MYVYQLTFYLIIQIRFLNIVIQHSNIFYTPIDVPFIRLIWINERELNSTKKKNRFRWAKGVSEERKREKVLLMLASWRYGFSCISDSTSPTRSSVRRSTPLPCNASTNKFYGYFRQNVVFRFYARCHFTVKYQFLVYVLFPPPSHLWLHLDYESVVFAKFPTRKLISYF